MHGIWPRAQLDAFPRFKIITLAKHGDGLLAGEPGHNLRMRAGRLDNNDIRVDTIVVKVKMLRADAANHRRPVARSRCSRQLDARLAWQLRVRLAAGSGEDARNEIHGR